MAAGSLIFPFTATAMSEVTFTTLSLQRVRIDMQSATIRVLLNGIQFGINIVFIGFVMNLVLLPLIDARFQAHEYTDPMRVVQKIAIGLCVGIVIAFLLDRRSFENAKTTTRTK
jgi:nitrate reductase gamma subunit